MIQQNSHTSEKDLDQAFDRLFEIMQTRPFLESNGIGNEVPLYIQPYPISAQDKVMKRIKALNSRLVTAGYDILQIDLLELVAEITSKGDRLQRLIEKEPAMPRDKMLSTMARWTDAKEHLVPAMKAHFAASNWQVALISGCGSVYPFLRTHSILENLQTDMDSRPVVFFFPGEYKHREAAGSELSLFSRLTHKGYYRAFNLDHYHL